ncbi:het-6-heterokaryon incompatibility [Fusarium agapanthi]|uniref:Het-6-heterokaryon incompatibility n=1 Tax=Fusarium agapanthi TaxID=1803897 RepID=A0A9P5E845_9HYPO|nr:het-6-heterokaryon incompatibility [Fusarium agapanthi]
MDVQPFTLFPYQPLKSDKLRLLNVEAGDDDSIRVELKTVKSRTSQRFWALSYVWGATENPATILLNDQPFSITRNLYNALYQYRRHAFDGYDSDKAMLWVDAICINQNDQVEKSIQVPRMSEIYGQCERVLAWLGPVNSDEESHVCRLADRLKYFQSPADPTSRDMSEDDRITVFIKSGRSNETASIEVESVRKALSSIGHRPWFRRIWILQEAVLAKTQPILLCGAYELGYEIFFKTWVLMLNPSEDGQLLYSFMAENPVRFKAIELVYKNILQARSETTPEQAKGSVSQEKQCALDIVKLLNETTELEATVAHDRLYALIGLLACDPLPSALQPDYAQSFEDLCYKFTMFILEQTQDIRVLNLGTIGNLPAVPSWTPDLRNSWTARSNLTPSPGKCFNVSEDGRTISMPAIVLGQCVSVCKPVTPDPDTGLVSSGEFLQFDEAIVKAAASIRRVTRMEVMTEWFKFHLSDIYTEERLTQNPIIVQRVMMAYVCMVHNQPLSSLGTRFGTAEQLHGAYGMVTDPIFQRSMVGCSSFVLQNGTSGQLLHSDAVAAVGDAVCVFPGLSTPFLTRRSDDGTCRIIGQVSKWESIGASLPAEQLESYRRSFEAAHLGREIDSVVRMVGLYGHVCETLLESPFAMTEAAEGSPSITTTAITDDAGPVLAPHSVKKSSSGHHMTGNDIPETPFLHKELRKISQAREKSESFHSLVSEKKSEIGCRDAAGKTALQIAVELDLMMEANTLVLAGADVTLGSFDEQKLIHSACHGGQTEVVKSLLGRITNINGTHINNETPLAVACQMGHLDIVNLLLENGADANVSDDNGWKPLHWACLGDQEEIVERLLQVDGLNISAIEAKMNQTQLNLAVERGHYYIVYLLLGDNTDLYIKNSMDWTPLMTATRAQDLEIVRMILGHRVGWRDGYLEVTDERHNTPLYVASMQGSCGIASELISAGAHCGTRFRVGDHDPHFPDGPGWTPLHVACFHDQHEIVSLLLPEIPLPGVEVDAEAENRRTPLHLASLSGNEIIVQLLLQRKADVNATDDEGCTPLHIASGYGPGWKRSIPELKVIPPDDNSCNDADPEKGCFDPQPRRYVPVMEVLLRNGADLTIKDEYGDTALDHAAIVGDKPRIETLLKFMESGALSWQDWRQSPIHSALGGYRPHVAMKWLLSEQEVKNAPFWKNGGRVQVIKEATKVEKPFSILDLIFRELPSKREVAVTGVDTWGPIQWAAHERLPCVLSKLFEDSSRSEDFAAMIHDALQATSKSITPKELEDDTSCELLVQVIWILITNSQRTPKNIKLKASAHSRDRELWEKRERRVRELGKELEVETSKELKSPTILDTLQDILKDPPFAQISQTHRDEVNFKPPVPRPNTNRIVQAAEATVVAFFKMKGESGRIRRNRPIKEVVYDPGPTEVVGTAIRNLLDMTRRGSMRFNSNLYANENLKLTWVIYLLPMSFFRDTWVEVPDKESRSRMMRPRSVIILTEKSTDLQLKEEETTESTSLTETDNEGNGRRGSEATERETKLDDSRTEDQRIYDDWDSKPDQLPKKPHEFVPASAIYMPYLSYSTHCKNWDWGLAPDDWDLKQRHDHYEELLDTYKGKDKQQHGSPTLDEWYYQFAQEDSEAINDQSCRNESQVVSKYLRENEREGDMGIYREPNQWTVVRVNQVWIWTVSTTTSSPLGGSPDSLVEEILNSLSKQGEYGGSGAQPVSASELLPAIIDHCIGSYERRPSDGKRIFIGQTLSHYINRIGRKETTLFDDFRAWSPSEYQQKRKPKNKEEECSPAESSRGWPADASPSTTIETNVQATQTTTQTHSHGHDISAAIKKAKDLYCDIKDVRDELNILKSVAQYQQIVQRGLASKDVDESRFSSTYVVKDLRELDSIAERIQLAQKDQHNSFTSAK